MKRVKRGLIKVLKKKVVKKVPPRVRKKVKVAVKKVPGPVKKGAMIGAMVPVPGGAAVGATAGGLVHGKDVLENVIAKKLGRKFRFLGLRPSMVNGQKSMVQHDDAECFADKSEQKLKPGIYKGKRGVLAAPFLNHEYVVAVPRDAKKLGKDAKKLKSVGGSKAIVIGAYNKNGKLKSGLNDKVDMADLKREGNSDLKLVTSRGVDKATQKALKKSKEFKGTKYPGVVRNVLGLGRNSNSYARSIIEGSTGVKQKAKLSDRAPGARHRVELGAPVSGYQLLVISGDAPAEVVEFSKVMKKDESVAQRRARLKRERDLRNRRQTRDNWAKTRDGVAIAGTAAMGTGAVMSGMAARKSAKAVTEKVDRLGKVAEDALKSVKGAADRTSAKSVASEVTKRVKGKAKQAFPLATKIGKFLTKRRKFLADARVNGQRSMVNGSGVVELSEKKMRIPKVYETSALPASAAGYVPAEGVNADLMESLNPMGLKKTEKVSERAKKSGAVVVSNRVPDAKMIRKSGYPDAKNLKKSMKRHEVIHSIQANKRGRGHRKIRELLKDEIGAYRKMDRRVKGGSKLRRIDNKIGGTMASTVMGIQNNPVLKKRAANYAKAGVGVIAAALLANKIRKKKEKSLSSMLPVVEFGGKEQLRYKDNNQYANAMKIASGEKVGYVIDANAPGGKREIDLPVKHAQVVKSALNKGKKIQRNTRRGSALVKDVGDVVRGKGRRRDASGRKKKREWEKGYFKNAVGTAVAGAGLLGGTALLRKNPRITSKAVKAVTPKKIHGKHVRKVYVDAKSSVKKGTNKFLPDLFQMSEEKTPAEIYFDAQANAAGWDVRDPRGRSARVFAPGSKRRVRREKEWYEKKDNQKKLVAGGLVTAALLGGLVGHKVGRGTRRLPKKKKVTSPQVAMKKKVISSRSSGRGYYSRVPKGNKGVSYRN